MIPPTQRWSLFLIVPFHMLTDIRTSKRNFASRVSRGRSLQLLSELHILVTTTKMSVEVKGRDGAPAHIAIDETADGYLGEKVGTVTDRKDMRRLGKTQKFRRNFNCKRPTHRDVLATSDLNADPQSSPSSVSQPCS